MDTMVRIAAIAVLAAVICVLMRRSEMTVALGMSVLTGLVILVLGLRFLQPIVSVVAQLEALSGLSKGVTKPLFKVVAIGILTQISESICTEAGEASLAKAVEISGTILAIYATLPLITSVLSLVEKLIGGSF